MAKVVLRFVTTRSLFSWIVRQACWSKFSHVEFALADGYLGAQGIGGVQLRPFDYEKNPIETFRYVNVTDKEYDAIMRYARAQIGKPYDWSGIFGIATHRDWHRANSWFCSELVAACFDFANHPLIKDKVDRVTPEMLFELPEVRQ